MDVLFPLPCFFFSVCSSAICKDSSNNHFAFFVFFFFGVILFTTSCTILWTSVHSFSGTLLTRFSPLNLFIISTANSYGIWFKSHLAGLLFFLVLFSLSLDFAMRSWWSESKSDPGLIFTDCTQLLHHQLQRM